MLRTNLATKPFYNERAVYVGLGVVALLGLAVLAILGLRIVTLSERNTDLTARAEQAEREGAELSARAAEVQRSVGPVALEEVAAAAREANTLIDQRVFSWTQFFNRIETTLPPDVMLTRVQPDIEPGLVEVTIGVVGSELEAISEFISALEQSGAFAELLNRDSERQDDGMYQAVLRGRYLQQVVPDAETGDAVPEPVGDAGDEVIDPDETETPDASEPDAGPVTDADPGGDAVSQPDEGSSSDRDPVSEPLEGVPDEPDGARENDGRGPPPGGGGR